MRTVGQWLLDPPNNLFALHTCDNKKCCNERHLFVGDHQSNMDDMLEKERQARGHAVFGSKLLAPQVLQIRALRKSMSVISIAANFGVSTTNVYNILNRKVWKHI